MGARTGGKTTIWLPFIRRRSGLDFWTFSLSSEINRRNGRHRSLVSGYPGYFFNAPGLLSPVIRRTRRIADLVHLNSWDGLLSAGSGKPVTVTVHRPPLQRKQAGAALIRCRERRIFAIARAITGVSRFVCHRVAEEFGIEPGCIYNGVDTRLFRPFSLENHSAGSADSTLSRKFSGAQDERISREDALRIRAAAGEEFYQAITNHSGIRLFYAGNLTMRKGADLLDELAGRLDRRFLLVCAGDRRDGRLFRRRRGVVSCGIVCQPVLASIFRSCHIFLFPVREEGFGLTLAEAMASGLPVVASHSGPVPEILSGDGGVLLQSRDIRVWEEAINDLADETGARERCGEINRLRVEKKFSLERMAGEYSEMFERLIEKELETGLAVSR